MNGLFPTPVWPTRNATAQPWEKINLWTCYSQTCHSNNTYSEPQLCVPFLPRSLRLLRVRRAGQKKEALASNEGGGGGVLAKVEGEACARRRPDTSPDLARPLRPLHTAPRNSRAAPRSQAPAPTAPPPHNIRKTHPPPFPQERWRSVR